MTIPTPEGVFYCPSCGYDTANPCGCTDPWPSPVVDAGVAVPTEHEIEMLAPEQMTVGKLNAVVRALREALYQARLKAQRHAPAQEPEKCWTCGGSPAKERECICGNTGLHVNEVQNMREELMRRREAHDAR